MLKTVRDSDGRCFLVIIALRDLQVGEHPIYFYGSRYDDYDNFKDVGELFYDNVEWKSYPEEGAKKRKLE